MNDLVILKRETGLLAPRRQGHLGAGKLQAHRAWLRGRMAQSGALKARELQCPEVARARQVGTGLRRRLLTMRPVSRR
jgi:hypothetical protein